MYQNSMLAENKISSLFIVNFILKCNCYSVYIKTFVNEKLYSAPRKVIAYFVALKDYSYILMCAKKMKIIHT